MNRNVELAHWYVNEAIEHHDDEKHDADKAEGGDKNFHRRLSERGGSPVKEAAANIPLCWQ